VRRGLAADTDEALRRIERGEVLVGGAPAASAARLTDDGEAVRVLAPPAFVGRGGDKLDAALADLGVDPTGRRALDVGSSTGGFTDCLLQGGAAQVVAVDVGTHQMHERLRADPRVQVQEQTDIRSVSAADLGGSFSLVVVDVSFVSLTALMAQLASLVRPGGDLVVLVKPQFEVSHREASRGRGVIRSPRLWAEAITAVEHAARHLSLVPVGATVSAVRGTQGNVEFFVVLRAGPPADAPDALPAGWVGKLVGTVVGPVEERPDGA
jgi:23S rRNA (cytidine1920-2'-O)/16S rRNA (cytidine1409-2'-O)-methyltransferase